MQKETPSLDAWIAELKASPEAPGIGMYLCHNGVVRAHSRAGDPVSGMELSYDADRLTEVIAECQQLPGVIHIRVWLNEGSLKVGDDIMYALVAGDIRPNVLPALQELVRKIKTEVVKEVEH